MSSKLTLIPLLLALTACTTAGPLPLTPTIAPTEPSQPTATSTVPPPNTTATTPPTATQVPTLQPTVLPPSATSAPYPALHTSGPYFLYTKLFNNQQVVVMMEPDGSGRRSVTLPPSARLPQPKNSPEGESISAAISPNGQWLAYYTGEWDTIVAGNSGPSNLFLNILNLQTGKVVKSISLLSSDYPSNFIKLAQKITALTEVFDLDRIFMAFTNGIRSVAWSPNSRYLAFAGQMNGLSSDLYLLDLSNLSVIQLGDDLQEIDSIDNWSADSQSVDFSTSLGYVDGLASDAHRVKLDGTPISFPRYRLINNLSDFEYAFAAYSLGGYEDLKIYSSKTDSTDLIWKDELSDYIVDRKSQTILISPRKDDGKAGQSLVLYNRPNRSFQTLSYDGNAWEITAWDSSYFRYLAWQYGGGSLIAIAANGTSKVLSNDAQGLSISSDNNYVAVVNYDPEPSILVLDKKADLIAEVQSLAADKIVWRPDSQAMFIKSGGNLIYMSNKDYSPVIVDQDLSNLFTYTWITPP